jgi:adenylate cyclase
MRCRACDTELIPGKSFCHACGAPVPRACPHCGAVLAAAFRFCPDCGHPIEGEAPTASPPAPQLSTMPEGLAEKIRALGGSLA